MIMLISLESEKSKAIENTLYTYSFIYTYSIEIAYLLIFIHEDLWFVSSCFEDQLKKKKAKSLIYLVTV
jgi:hypothetical protein